MEKNTLRSCYKFNKADFNQTLKMPDDLLVYIIHRDSGTYISFGFFSSRGTSYADFKCTDDELGNYKCFKFNTSEKINLQYKDDTMHMHIKHLQMTLPSESTSYNIRSISSTFSKGSTYPCPLVSARLVVDE